MKPTGCATVPFEPSIAVDPGTDADRLARRAPRVEVKVPFDAGAADRQLERRGRRSVSLPLGHGPQPRRPPNGLAACTDDQFGKGTRNPVACPAASKIGTVAIETPPLPAGSLTGNVFLGKQLSRDPTSGNEYRIFVDAESARYGISARLIGNVSADPQTGQLTTTFADNPQVPFTSFKLDFDGGDRAALTSPPDLRARTPRRSRDDPWSGNPDRPPPEAVHPDQRARRRRLRENAGRARPSRRASPPSRQAPRAGAFSPSRSTSPPPTASRS